MIGCLFNPLSCAPSWLTFILGSWEWLLASFLLGLGIGALTGWKGLLVAVSGGLALIWLRRRPADEPAGQSVRMSNQKPPPNHPGRKDNDTELADSTVPASTPGEQSEFKRDDIRSPRPPTRVREDL